MEKEINDIKEKSLTMNVVHFCLLFQQVNGSWKQIITILIFLGMLGQ